MQGFLLSCVCRLRQVTEKIMFKIYYVGGCVRDFVMGREPKDIDYVVVGATHEQMIELGYKKVGADFPVYLHPETGDEYALARRERSTGPGYTDFECEFGKDVTLEEDLYRRDLTMNAMAQDIENGEIIDPYNGREHIKQNIVELVNPKAFLEDPVRILRAIRFANRYSMTMGKSTQIGIIEAQANGVMKGLTSNRIWKEVEKTMEDGQYHNFVSDVYSYGIDFEVFGISLANHTRGLMTYNITKESSHVLIDSKMTQFAASMMFVPRDDLETVLKKIKPPSKFKKIARLTNQNAGVIIPHKRRTTASKIVHMFEQSQAFNDVAFIRPLINVMIGTNPEYSQLIINVFMDCKVVDATMFPDIEPGVKLGKAIREKRVSIVEEVLNDCKCY